MDILMQKIRDFNSRRGWKRFHTPRNLASSISIEAAELLEHYQWVAKTKNIEECFEEVADIMIYCMIFCDSYGMDPLQIIEKKLEKNGKKYPIHYKTKKYKKRKT